MKNITTAELKWIIGHAIFGGVLLYFALGSNIFLGIIGLNCGAGAGVIMCLKRRVGS